MTSPNKKEYRLVKYSFVINNEDFKPSNSYNHSEKNGKLYVNLRTRDERTNFFNELQEFNKNNEIKVKARELSYEYFVRSSQKNTDDSYRVIKFTDLINHIKSLINDDDILKELNNCFKVSNEWKNFKVSVTSHDLAKVLNSDKMFFPYRRQQQFINVDTQTHQNDYMYESDNA